MADALTTSANLATAGGTLVLAIATFASIRSSQRSARTAERALLAGLRPVLMSSRLQDDEQKVSFQDGKWLKIPGGFAIAEVTDQAIYLAISVRNVGSGMAVLHGWTLSPSPTGPAPEHGDPGSFHRLTRDLYVPPSEVGFWQGALRDPDSAEFKDAQAAIESKQRVLVEVLYGDHEGGQRVITMFSLMPVEDGRYIAATARHWNLDRDDPR